MIDGNELTGLGNGYLKHVLEFYNRMAGLYDLCEFVRRGTRREVLELSGFRISDRVLDVCTGTGEMALAFASQGADVIGIDISRGMLARAARKRSHRKPTWLEMNAITLPFKDDTFDISTISLALHHMPEATQCRVLAEMARVSRRRIVIVEPHTPANPRLWPAWVTIFSRLDESEHMCEWVRQDFAGTCQVAGLKIEEVRVTTLGIHRITLCTPDGLIRHPTLAECS